MKNKKKFLYAFIAITLLATVGAVRWYMPASENLSNMTVTEKKDRFRNLIIPEINEIYLALSDKHQLIVAEVSAKPNSRKLAKLRKEYRAQDNQALLRALKPHPRSIAIAQAAMESAWATSRFYREANNLFGIWSFSKNEPRIAAGERRGDKTVWLKKYPSTKASISDYYRSLARDNAFKGFRALKMQTDDPFKLVKKLDRYSENGALYSADLASIIKFNKFTQYDK